jgi:DNA-binding NarL/FixJ family response regulator
MVQSRAYVIIADDHPLVRGALHQSVNRHIDGVKVDEFGDFDGLSNAMSNGAEPDLLLLDLTMPGVEGFSGLIYLRSQYPHVPVIVVSGHHEAAIIRRAIDFGASGFIPKTSDDATIGEALTSVIKGETWTPPGIDLAAPIDRDTADLLRKIASLTPQQMRVLMMLRQGLLNKQIAYELSVSEATVKAHVSAILQKLDVDSRTQAVIVAAKIAAISENSLPLS